jgi:myb proto-oncogene protein
MTITIIIIVFFFIFFFIIISFFFIFFFFSAVSATDSSMNFSLYRGKLHKVPDVPRRWPLSKPSMSLRVFQKAIAKRQEAVRRFHAKELLKHDPAAAEAVEASNAEAPAPPPDARDAWNSSAIDGVKRERAEKRKREDAETLASVENEAAEKKTRASARSAEEDGENVVTDLSDLRTHTRISGPQDSRPQSEDAEPAHRPDHVSDAAAAADNGNDKEKEAERLEAPRTPAAKDEDCIKSAERVRSL